MGRCCLSCPWKDYRLRVRDFGRDASASQDLERHLLCLAAIAHEDDLKHDGLETLKLEVRSGGRYVHDLYIHTCDARKYAVLMQDAEPPLASALRADQKAVCMQRNRYI